MLPLQMHDSGLVWAANPSPWDTFSPCHLPVLIGALNNEDLTPPLRVGFMVHGFYMVHMNIFILQPPIQQVVGRVVKVEVARKGTPPALPAPTRGMMILK